MPVGASVTKFGSSPPDELIVNSDFEGAAEAYDVAKKATEVIG